MVTGELYHTAKKINSNFGFHCLLSAKKAGYSKLSKLTEFEFNLLKS